jgi:hypothetical protein
MNATDVSELAKRYLVSSKGLSKPQLIRKIQRAQGNLDCFATGKSSCEHIQCPWRVDCLGESDADSSTLLQR